METNSITLNKLRERMDLLIHNPALMQRHMLMLFGEAMGGANMPVDPTSPFMQLIEGSVTAASAAVDHQIINLSKRYPVLAQTADDLYEHMSNEDYRNRFSIPASGEFTLVMPIDTLLASAINSINGVYRYVSIPLDTQVEVDDIAYSFRNTIEIRIHRNKVIKVVQLPNTAYDRLNTNIVKSEVLRDNDNIPLLTFNIELTQIRKQQHIRTIISSATFREYFDFKESFQSILIYYRGPNQTWIPMEYSHSDQTFDISVPKAIIKVMANRVYVYIPPIYTKGYDLGGEIQIVIYTSTGAMDVDYADIKNEFFETHINDVDSQLTYGDIAFTHCSYTIYSTDHIVGGRDELSFEELKNRTLSNNVGVNRLPITPSAMITNAEDFGFDAVMHLDTLTDRVYLLSSPIPVGKNLNTKTEPDVGFIQLMESIDSLALYDTILDNGDSVTILPTTLYEIDQLNVRILNKDVSEAYKELDASQRVNAFNATDYRYSPFFYVMTQNRDVLECVVYQLDVPKVDYISFLDQNASVDYYLTQTGIRVDYKEGYYEVTALVQQDKSLSTLSKEEIYGQLSFFDAVNGLRVYIEHHSIIENIDGFVIVFRLENTLNIVDGDLGITNTVSINGISNKPFISLNSDVFLTYGTTTYPQGYIQTEMDDVTYNREYARRYPLTLERVNITFGKELTYLWKDVRPVGTKVEYMHAEFDVLMVYLENVYNGDPEYSVNADCSIDVEIIHKKGDTVLDVNGDPVYKYRTGDLLLDDTGNPIRRGYTEYSYYIDVLVNDGVYFIINDKPMLKHMQWISDYIVKQSTTVIAPLQAIKLEHTDLLYRPRDSLGHCEVFTSKYKTTWINKRAFLNIVIYVEETIYNNIAARQIIEHTTFEVVNNNLRKQVISHDVITSELKKVYQLGVISVSIVPTDDAGKLASMALKDPNDRISLRKKSFVTAAGLVSVKEDIAIDFVDYTVK